MKLKKYILNEATKNMNSMLDFIMKNRNFIQYDHQVEELWQSVATAKFKKDTGFYPTISRWEWKIADLGWELKNTDKMNYEDILKDFQNFSSKTSDSPQEMTEKSAFTSLLQYARWDGRGTITGISDYDLNSLIRFLRYVIYGKLDKNLAEANKIIDDYLRPKEGVFRGVNDFKNVKLPEVGNIDMTRFKNGKIVIKGLNSRQLAHITKIIEMVSKFNR